jgi:hypothetical protein
MADLSEIFILHYLPWSPGYKGGNFTDIREWKAYKGKLNLCLQTLKSSTTNGQANTTAVDSTIGMAWEEGASGWYCAQHEQESNKLCMSGNQWQG